MDRIRCVHFWISSAPFLVERSFVGQERTTRCDVMSVDRIPGPSNPGTCQKSVARRMTVGLLSAAAHPMLRDPCSDRGAARRNRRLGPARTVVDGAEPARQSHFSTSDDRFFRIGSASRWANPEMSGAKCASGADCTGSRITYQSLLKTNAYEICCDSLDPIGSKCTTFWVWSSLYGSSPEFVTP